MNRLENKLPRCHKPGWPKYKPPNEPLLKKPIPPMTQIVGIVCKESVNYSPRDTIVIACESQYTIGGSGEKVTDAQKMSTIKFSDGKEVLIAQAGNTELSARAVRFMSEIAKDRLLNGEFCVANIAEEAINRVRSEMLAMMQPRDYSIEEQKQLFGDEENNFALMIGHFYDVPRETGSAFATGGNPRLWTISLYSPIAVKEFPYAALGTGSRLARFNLSKSHFKKIKWELAVPKAIHVIEQVKGSDVYCDGTVRVGIVERHGVQFYGEDLVREFTSEIKRIQRKLDSEYEAELIATVNRVATKRKKAAVRWQRKRSEI